MRFLIIGLVLVAMLFCSCSCMGEITQADLRNFARSSVNNDDFEQQLPSFGWKGDYLVYSLGGVHISESIVSPSLSIPIREQMRIALIEKTRNTPIQRQFWQPLLRRVEQQVGQMLHLINHGNLDQKTLMDKLNQMANRINNMYDSEINAFAKRNGRLGAVGISPKAVTCCNYPHVTTYVPVTVYRPVQETVKRSHASDVPHTTTKYVQEQVYRACTTCPVYTVKFIVTPAYGKIRVVPLGKWKLNQFLRSRGEPARELDWLTVHETTDLPLGKYQMHCDWPNGQVCNNDIQVTRTGQEVMVMPDYY